MAARLAQVVYIYICTSWGTGPDTDGCAIVLNDVRYPSLQYRGGLESYQMKCMTLLYNHRTEAPAVLLRPHNGTWNVHLYVCLRSRGMQRQLSAQGPYICTLSPTL